MLMLIITYGDCHTYAQFRISVAIKYDMLRVIRLSVVLLIAVAPKKLLDYIVVNLS
jgi:hypothetical protein